MFIRTLKRLYDFLTLPVTIASCERSFGKLKTCKKQFELGRHFLGLPGAPPTLTTSLYLINCSPTRSLDGKKPEEAWSGKKPYVGHLKIFGSMAMVHVPKQKRKKLDPKSTECVFVGYAEDTKGYRLYNPESNEIVISRDVKIVNEGRSGEVTPERSKPVEFLEIVFSDTAINEACGDLPAAEQHEGEATGSQPNLRQIDD